ncbi:hypothetical protein PQX77_013378 [Marasmius sp. AFHP31]|nr:hypothetical protein PQX77_013378 [Marasmius sp. AFHP31]
MQTDLTATTNTAPSESKLHLLGTTTEEDTLTPPAQPESKPEPKVETHEVFFAELQAKLAMMHGQAKLEAGNIWVTYEFGDGAGAGAGMGGVVGAGAMDAPAATGVGAGSEFAVTPGAQAV